MVDFPAKAVSSENAPRVEKSMAEQKKKLSEYVKERMADGRFPLFSVFGEETGGNYLRWTFGLQRFEHFSSERQVLVHVPRTDSGIEPTCAEAQPYAWSGKVNADAAESAVWHAFEILTEAEAREFREAHAPEVVFEFMENFVSESLCVKFVDGDWYVMDG